jgi:hypothetical protein
MKLLDCFPMLFAFEYFVACFGDCGSSIPYGKIFFQVNLFFPLLMISTLSPVLELVSAGQRVNICSRSCSDLLQGNKLNTFFVSDCE